jgi:hypothetical protein
LANPIDGVCPRCLVPGHNKDTYKGQLRCKYCYNYGHAMKRCLTRTQ